MRREELKSKNDELMRQYSDEEIDGATYFQEMMDVAISEQNENESED